MLVVVIVLISVNFLLLSPEPLLTEQTLHKGCVWKQRDPVLFHLRTHSGVTYDGGHWFHMSENFMVQHSILRAKDNFATSSEVYFNFDRSKGL